MKSLTLFALLLAGVPVYGQQRQTPVMRPAFAPAVQCPACAPSCDCGPACPCPAGAVQLLPTRPEVRPDAGELRKGPQATDATATLATLAVGQCPGGNCSVPQRGATVSYSYPAVTPQLLSNPYQFTPVASAPVAYAERPRLFARLFGADRPRLFGRLFGGGKCCGK